MNKKHLSTTTFCFYTVRKIQLQSFSVFMHVNLQDLGYYFMHKYTEFIVNLKNTVSFGK